MWGVRVCGGVCVCFAPCTYVAPLCVFFRQIYCSHEIRLRPVALLCHLRIRILPEVLYIFTREGFFGSIWEP